MRLDDALDRLAWDAETLQAELLAALEMHDEGVAVQPLTFRRRFPDLSEDELTRKLEGWLATPIWACDRLPQLPHGGDGSAKASGRQVGDGNGFRY